MLQAIGALFSSRKSLIGMTAMVVLVGTFILMGLRIVPANAAGVAFMVSVAGVAGILISGIAYEDAATKVNAGALKPPPSPPSDEGGAS